MNKILIPVVAVLALTGCGHFRLVKDRYQATKKVAIVQVVGAPAEGVTTPLHGNITGPSPWESVVTNDAIALQDFLKQRGFDVAPIDEMVKSDRYQEKTDYVPNGVYTPRGMKIASSKYGIKTCDISFMSANALAKNLGVDAVICVYEKWDTSGMFSKNAKTQVTVAMVDRMSSQVWEDQDEATSADSYSAMSGSDDNLQKFIHANNEAFVATLQKMGGRIDAALAGH